MKKKYLFLLLALIYFPLTAGAEETALTSVDTNKMPSLFLSYEECVEKLKVPFRLEAETEYTIQVLSQAEGKPLPEDQITKSRQTYKVLLESDGMGDFHVKYQTEGMGGRQKAGGEAIFTKGQYFRRLNDTPFIHRALETGEKGQFFLAQDQTKAIFELFYPFANVQNKEKGLVQNRKTFEVQLTPKWKELPKEEKDQTEPASLTSHRKQMRKQMKVDELQATILVDEQTKAPLSVEWTSSFEPSATIFQQPSSQNSSTLERKSSNKKLLVHHTLKLTLLKDPISISQPDSYQKTPSRKRYFQQEQRKQLLEKAGNG